MERGKKNPGPDSRKAQQVISTAVDAAEALILGVGRLAERAIAETARAADDVRTEIDAALSRVKKQASKAPTSAKTKGRRRRRPVA